MCSSDLCHGTFRTGKGEQRFCSPACQYEWQGSGEWSELVGNAAADFAERTRRKRELEFAERFEDKYPNFRYVSGYVNSESTFVCQCRLCGHMTERTAQVARPSRTQELWCDGCHSIRLKNRELELEWEREWKQLLELKDNIAKIIDNRIKVVERELLLWMSCQRCGVEFRASAINRVNCDSCVTAIERERGVQRREVAECEECETTFVRIHKNSKYCSAGCSSRAHTRNKEFRRRKRLARNGRVDREITLSKVLRRHKGICSLCGGEVDESDFTYDGDGNFIVGREYPSIDHIKPISKGGTHTWDNVQLAHHYCNTLKGDLAQSAS